MKIKATYSLNIGRKVTWGIIFIIAAVLIVLDALNVLPDIPIMKILFATVFTAWGIVSLIKLRFSQVFFPLAFAFMILESEIAPFIGQSADFISNWLVLLVALLLTIGFSLIFTKKVHKHSFSESVDNSEVSKTVNTFGEGVKYVDCASFTKVNVSNSFGEYHVRFQNVELYDGGATVNVSNSFGETNIYVPSHWTVRFKVHPTLGAANCPMNIVENGPELAITGATSFGEVNVHFV